MQRTQSHSTRRRRIAVALLSLGLAGAGLAFAPSASALPADDFKPVVPKRILETRGSPFDTTPDNATKAANNSVTEVQVTSEGGVVPPGADAVAVNVTGVESVGNDGYLTVWDCDDTVEGNSGLEPDPPNASNVNLTSNDIRPNAVISRLSDAGKICIYSRNSTHLLVDVTGYFPGTALTSNHIELSDEPERILDTRPGLLVNYGAGKPVAGQVLKVPLPSSAEGPSAQILNVTGVDGTGWLTVWDCTDANTEDNAQGLTEPDPPNVSALNLHAGIIAANLVISKASANEQVCVFTSAGSHVIVDYVGEFPSATSDFKTVGPTRVLETRPAPFDTTPDAASKFGAGSKVSLSLDEHINDAVGPVNAVAINVTGTDSATGFVSIYPCNASGDPVPGGGTLPNTSNLNLVAGQTRPNMVISDVGTADRICIFTQNPTHIIVDLVGVFAAHPAPV